MSVSEMDFEVIRCKGRPGLPTPIVIRSKVSNETSPGNKDNCAA